MRRSMIIVLVDLATDNDNNTKSVNNGYTDSRLMCAYIYIYLYYKYTIYIYDLTISIPIILQTISMQ